MPLAETKRNYRATGMAELTPALTVRDVDKEINFCIRAFGLEKGYTASDKTGKTAHGDMKYEGTTIVMFGREGAMGCPTKSPATTKVDCPINLYIYCQDVDELCKRAKIAGATVISEPADMFWGDRVATLKDPEGYSWTFATNIADFDPAKVPKDL
jgi:PhnB protein